MTAMVTPEPAQRSADAPGASGALASPPDSAPAFPAPPRVLGPAGDPRRVGVEIEFAALSARDGAAVIQDLFGGRVEEVDPHRFRIRDTVLGDFVSELDSQYVHGEKDAQVAAAEDAPDGPLGDLLRRFQDDVRTLVGDVSSLVVPCEIVCPPVPLATLGRIEEALRVLVEAGAEGTRANPLYAFGAQLNVEIAGGSDDHDTDAWILSMLKAWMLLSDWLRGVMGTDLTRRMTAFAGAFPKDYALTVVDPAYWPDRAGLIDDYLTANPTRNRELDLLPLFSWLDGERVAAVVSDTRVTPRPAFHDRLPDANLGEPGWGLGVEWRRWLLVERLADNRALLDAMGAAYLAHHDRVLPAAGSWAMKASEWLLVGGAGQEGLLQPGESAPAGGAAR